MNIEQKKGLQAPVVPVADVEDGLIKTADLMSDVVVSFPLWAEAEERDTHQLLINGILVGQPLPLSSPLPKEVTLMISIEEELKEDGIYAVGYRATRFLGGTFADSPATIIKVDRTAPGASLLAPMIFPDVTLAENLLGTVPGYAGMQAGDVIQSLCNGIKGATYRVKPENMTTRPVEVTFRREFLQTLDSEEVVIDYHVTDRAGNQSMTAQPVTLSLQL